MKTVLLILLAGFFPFAVAAPSAPQKSTQAPPALKSKMADDKLSLVFADEFNGNGKLDSKKWGFDIGGNGWGNGQAEFNTDRTENARVKDGFLIIEAHKENYKTNAYTSARVISLESWTYGRFEVRAKLPRGAGMWPAIWLLAKNTNYGNALWPDNGEIDIMENFAARPDEVAASLHTRGANWPRGNQLTNYVKLNDLATAFHVYTLDWTPDKLSIAVDGTSLLEFKNPGTGWEAWPFDKPFYLILNLAVGGIGGGEVDDGIFPQRFLIDYVRVYQMQDKAIEVAEPATRKKQL